VSDLEAEVASGHVQIEQLRDGIRVNVSDEILFPSGSAEFDDHGREVLKKVAAQIANSPHQVEVEGHTDDVAIVGVLAQRYPTNWELAGARAAQVVRLFQDEGIDGSRMRAISNAEFDPTAANDSPEGRQQNRRIGIRLIPAG
jgi:chemotaxis protein MotB